MNILLTGGTGFIGKYLVNDLINHNYNLKIISRKNIHKNLKNTKYIKLDLIKDEINKTIVDDIDIVIHLAFNKCNNFKKTDNANVIASKKLIHACEKANIRKFIFFSSVKVLGEITKYEYDETIKPNPQTSYAKEKMTIENLLQNSGLNYVIIRLPPVYGNGTQIGIFKLINILKYFYFIPSFTNKNKKSLIHAKDVASFTMDCITNNNIKREIFIITDNRTYSTYEILSILINKEIIKARIIQDNYTNKLLELISKKIHTKMFNILFSSAFYSCKKAIETLNFSPRYNLYNSNDIF